MLLGAVLALAACSSGSDDPPVAAPTSVAPTTSVSATPSATPSAAALPACDSLLPFTDLDSALGRPLFGDTRFIEGVAQPSIGRTARVTCQYGIAKGARGAPPVEVGISTYTDAAAATKRISDTIASARAGGATSQSDVTIAGAPGTLLGSKTDFTAVVAQGNRTVVVTVQRSTRGQPDKSAVRVTDKVLTNWGQ